MVINNAGKKFTKGWTITEKPLHNHFTMLDPKTGTLRQD